MNMYNVHVHGMCQPWFHAYPIANTCFVYIHVKSSVYTCTVCRYVLFHVYIKHVYVLVHAQSRKSLIYTCTCTCHVSIQCVWLVTDKMVGKVSVKHTCTCTCIFMHDCIKHNSYTKDQMRGVQCTCTWT